MKHWWSQLVGGKTVNGRALLIVMGVVVILGAGIYFLHGFQVRRNARGLLEQANVAEAEGDKQLAATYLAQYLGLNPLDNDALARLGMFRSASAANSYSLKKAFEMLDQAVRRNPALDDARREVVRLSTRIGDYGGGKEHLQVLLAATKDPDFELLQLSGRCEAGLHNYDKASEFYKKAMLKAPHQTEVAFEYATILRERLKLPGIADATIDQMVNRDRSALKTRLQAAQYFARFGLPERAWPHLRFLLDAPEPPSAEVLHLAGEVALARGEAEEARRYFQQGNDRFPDDGRMNRGLAQVEVRRGESARALAILTRSQDKMPKQPVELWGLANLLIDAGAIDQVREVINELGKTQSKGLIQFLEARLLVRKGSWGEAARLLEQARRDREFSDNLAKHANLLLAECAERLLQPERRLDALQRAVDLDPNWLPGLLKRAETLAALGKTDLALAALRPLAAHAPLAKEDVVKLLVVRNRRLAPAQRDWTEVNRLLDELPSDVREQTRTKLLVAEVRFLAGQEDEARKLVEAERTRRPAEIAPWLFLAALEERKTSVAAALKVIDEAEQKLGPLPDWVSARARLYLKGDADVARKQAATWLKQLDQFDGVARERVLATLAATSAALGDAPAALRLWSELAERAPNDLPVWIALLDSALDGKALDEARRALTQIRRLEGGDGPQTAVGEAALLLSAPKLEAAVLTEARGHLARAAAARPGWGRVPLLEALIHEREGQLAQALEKYKAALERGEGRLAVVQRTIQLMYDQRQYGEANLLLRKLPEQALETPELGRLAAQLTIQLPGEAGDDPQLARKRALELARKAVSEKSKNHREYIWLGQMAALAGSKAEAEKALRRACELQPAAPEAWTALVAFLATNEPKQAEAEIDKARQHLPGDIAPLALGSCYEILGKMDQAEEQYQALLQKRPKELLPLRNLSAFYARTAQFAKAEPVLRQCLELREGMQEPVASWARRNLALAIAYQGGYPRFQEAQRVLAVNLKARDTTEDRLVEAIVLATHPSHRRDAIARLESVPARGGALPVEMQFMLARLYESDGAWDKAKRHLLDILAVQGKNPALIAHYARGLLREKQGAEAQTWIDRLAAVAPDRLETLDLQVQAAKLTGGSNTDDAVKRVTTYAQTKDARLELAARWLELLDQQPEAEKLYRAFVAGAKQPESVLVLAQYLGRRQRLGEALKLCDAAWKDSQPEAVASTSIMLVRAPSATAADKQRVERLLLDALERHPKARGLPLFLAELYDTQDKHDQAIGLLQSMLKQDDRNIVALNNLAYLLATRKGETATALKLVTRAIELAGPVDELLDTRAIVHLKNEQPDLAAKDLQEAIARALSAMLYFHLAQAQQLGKDRRAAATSLRQALNLGLVAAQVHPLERPAFEKLVAELN